jgi:DNA-binding NarL/FixJ family response regulator
VGGPFRVLVADHFEPWRRLVYWLFQQDQKWQIIGQASDGLEAVQKTQQLQPDLIVLDVAVPKLSASEAARQIQSVAPGTKILFMSEDYSPEIELEALRVGARGYVVKTDAATDLLPTAKAVIGDKRFVAPPNRSTSNQGPCPERK